MKQHLYALADPKMRDRFFNILQSTNSSNNGRNGNGFSNVNDKNGAVDYHANLQHQLYAPSSAATLQQLKRLLIENAKELKKCKNELLEKNNEIERLKEENETFRTRLERMERRLSLQKIPSPPRSPPVASEYVVESAQPLPDLQQTFKRPRSRSRSVSTSKVSRAQKRRRSETSTEAATKRVKNKIQHPSTASLDEISTPIWRVLPFSSSFALEGTENITEDAFAKRHQKFENEEKRIIRRDKARQRELELRRKQGMHENGISSSSDPDLNIEAIEIVKKLPRPKNGRSVKCETVPRRERRPK